MKYVTRNNYEVLIYKRKKRGFPLIDTKTGKPACYLDTGIFQALFSEFFGLPVRVIEIQCCSMGDENCVFEIEPFKRK